MNVNDLYNAVADQNMGSFYARPAANGGGGGGGFAPARPAPASRPPLATPVVVSQSVPIKTPYRTRAQVPPSPQIVSTTGSGPLDPTTGLPFYDPLRTHVYTPLQRKEMRERILAESGGGSDAISDRQGAEGGDGYAPELEAEGDAAMATENAIRDSQAGTGMPGNGTRPGQGNILPWLVAAGLAYLVF